MMRVKIIVITILLNLLGVTVSATRVVTTLTELTKPDAMQAKDGKLYILEKTTIYIYSLKTLELFKQFGRAGEGPGEFMARPFGPPMTISFYENFLVVNSNNRMSYFTLDGKFVKEEKSPHNSVSMRVKGGYLTIGPIIQQGQQAYLGFKLFDEKFLNPKILYISEWHIGNLRKITLPTNPLNYYPIENDNLFIINAKKGFVIDRFDHTGKKLDTIEKNDAERIKVPATYKNKALEWFRINPMYKNFFTSIKASISIKEYYPAIKSIMIDEGKLYVMTNKTKDNEFECQVLNTKGKTLTQTYVPLEEEEPYTYHPLLCCVEKGTYYALLSNEDEDAWELHVKKIL